MLRNSSEAKRSLALRILRGAKLNLTHPDHLRMEKEFKKFGVEYPMITRHSNLHNNVK